METLFRELSAEEIDLVAGSGDIVVTGTRYGGGSGWSGGWGGGWGGGSGDGGFSSDNDPGSGEPTPPPQTPCELDEAKDEAAKGVEDSIRQQSDWAEREYGALILRDSSGYVYVQTLVAGETVAEAEARAIAAGDSSYAPRIEFGTVPAGFTVIGVVHSHPDVGYDAAQDLDNRYPSQDDYMGFSNLVGIHPSFSSQADFTQYIFGPDGVLREFDWTDGPVTYSNDPEAATRSHLESDRPCA